MKSYIMMGAMAALMCFAAPNDAGAETPADKLKREKAETAALDEQKAALEASAAAEAESIARDAEVLAKQDAAKLEEARAAALADGDEDEDGEDPHAEAKAAHKQLETIALSYPLTTPDEHVIFGFGGHRFSLGHLRALFGLKRP